MTAAAGSLVTRLVTNLVHGRLVSILFNKSTYQSLIIVIKLLVYVVIDFKMDNDRFWSV